MSLQILNGAQAIKQAYELTLAENTVDFICLSTKYDDILEGYFDRDYSPRLMSRAVTRELLADTPANRTSAAKKDAVKHAVKFITAAKSESDVVLFGNRAILISYNKNAPYAVLVTDEDLVANMKAQFEALWKSL